MNSPRPRFYTDEYAPAYAMAFDLGLNDCHEFANYKNPFPDAGTMADIAKHSGYRDGFRCQCLRLRLTWPEARPLYRSPLPKED